MVEFNWYAFSELTLKQLYDLLALRSAVFVLEQQCPYLDPDGKDIDAFHLLATEKNELVAYLRLIPPTDKNNHLIFGRVVSAKFVRSKGYGKKIMEELLHYCHTHFPDSNIQCSAQFYLKRFYASFGFHEYGEVYDEDGIPHIAMQRHAPRQ